MPVLRRLPWVLLVAAGALLGLGAGGCGSGSAPSASGVPPAPADAVPPAKRVVIADFAYRPRRLVVDVGTQITWVNRDAANHTVTFRGGAPGALGNVRKGRTVRTRLTTTGRYRYFCAFHPAMKGSVLVLRR